MDGLPIIDIAGVRSADPAQRRATAAALGKACRQVGFFYITGHAIPDTLRHAIFAAAHDLFAAPAEEKARIDVRLSPHNRGYIGFGVERLDEHSTPDQKEAFNLGLELPPGDPELTAAPHIRGANLWPDLPGWRDTVLSYYAACEALMGDIHRAFAIDLDLAEDFFDPKLTRSASILRLLHYPAGPAGSRELGAGEHTDYGNVTILATDGVAGLQVRRRDGAWLDAPHVPGAFVCNIADCLMRWTNDVYVSTPHRVVQPAAERYSVAFFGDANPYAMVEAIPSCVKPGEQPKYPPINCHDYLQMRLNATYDHLQAGQETAA